MTGPLPPVALEPGTVALATRDQNYRLGLELESRGLFEQAVAACAAAVAIDLFHAELQFRLASRQLADGKLGEAQYTFAVAPDNDALAVRADSRINGIVRAAAARHKGEHLLALDAEVELSAGQADGLLGNETFDEHVHFTVEGNFRIARLMVEKIRQQLLVSMGAVGAEAAEFAACSERLTFTLWDRKRVWNVALDRILADHPQYR